MLEFVVTLKINNEIIKERVKASCYEEAYDVALDFLTSEKDEIVDVECIGIIGILE